MIKFIDINQALPYKRFTEFHNVAISKNQKNIEALSISTYSKINKEVDSRFVNLKYIRDDEWIFFTNYESNKSIQINEHNQISALLYWDCINVQIRLKAKIYKTDAIFSDHHYKTRNIDKNALAHSSNQSRRISTYEKVVQNYNEKKASPESLNLRPEYWGGFSFKPYCFEFWEGHQSRINKREVFTIKNKKWYSYILQP